MAKARRVTAERVHDRLASQLPINSRVVVSIVDDPFARGEKIKVLRSVRNDPLAGMYSRAQIDDAQLSAGRKWQRHYEGAEIGSIRAIDPTKEAVDGGSISDPITQSQIHALKMLSESAKALGQEGYYLVRDVLGEGLTISAAAAKRGLGTDLEVKYIGRRFRECLETLGKLWGFCG